MRKFFITETQLNELINNHLFLSSESTPEYCASSVSTTEPVGDELYGLPVTGDEKAQNMPPSLYARMTSKGVYSGPLLK